MIPELWTKAVIKFEPVKSSHGTLNDIKYHGNIWLTYLSKIAVFHIYVSF
jgi:hypothetical protein